MKHRTKLALGLATLAATTGLAACGSSDSESEAVSGNFEAVSGAPAEYVSVAGEGTLERSDEGTNVSLKATGLEPKTAYVAHLHTEGCDQAAPGGPHFKFDARGSDEPPNEIHLEFSSNASGSGSARASSDAEVPVGEAGSVVLHEAEAEHKTAGAAGEGEAVFVHEGHHHEDSPDSEHSAPAMIACAELEGGSTAASGDGTTAAGDVAAIVIRDGKPVGGIQELEYSAGEEVRFRVASDVADEVHVHGYDLMQDVTAGGSVEFAFPADLEGIFEVELEGRGEQILELRVNP